ASAASRVASGSAMYTSSANGDVGSITWSKIKTASSIWRSPTRTRRRAPPPARSPLDTGSGSSLSFDAPPGGSPRPRDDTPRDEPPRDDDGHRDHPMVTNRLTHMARLGASTMPGQRSGVMRL